LQPPMLFITTENLESLLTINKLALKLLARRCLRLSEEIFALEGQIARLASKAAPHLLALKGLSTDTAAVLPVAALKTSSSA
jgi:hypothetical protein